MAIFSAIRNASAAKALDVVIATDATAEVSRGPVARFFHTWHRYWWDNRVCILNLTLVNTAITFSTELVARSMIAPLFGGDGYSFFVFDQLTGAVAINQQSLVNIFMTIFASLIGGPVYFIKSRLYRFLFFAAFGASNSLVAQSLAGFLRFDVWIIQKGRLLFDVIYNSTLKYFVFEYGRKPIVKARNAVLKIGWVRIQQDMLTTMSRVATLNLFGFKG